MPWPDARPGPESHPGTSLQHIVLYMALHDIVATCTMRAWQPWPGGLQSTRPSSKAQREREREREGSERERERREKREKGGGGATRKRACRKEREAGP